MMIARTRNRDDRMWSPNSFDAITSQPARGIERALDGVVASSAGLLTAGSTAEVVDVMRAPPQPSRDPAPREIHRVEPRRGDRYLRATARRPGSTSAADARPQQRPAPPIGLPPDLRRARSQDATDRRGEP